MVVKKQKHPLITITHPNCDSHLIRADLTQISSQHTIVQAIEHKQEAHVHPDRWLLVEHVIQSKEGAHHDYVPYNAQSIAQLVDKVKVLVDETGSRSQYRFGHGLPHHKGSQCGEYHPQDDKAGEATLDADPQGNDPQADKGAGLEERTW